MEVSGKLNKECEQIFSKQNLNSSSYSNLDLNQLALVAIHSLSNQHLVDEAKQLYNETVIRALKQEYELISSEKNDLIEQIGSECSQSRENIDWNSFPLEENLTTVNQDGFEVINTNIEDRVRPELIDCETQTDDQQQEKMLQMNNKLKRALQTIKEKVHRIVTEKPELFPEIGDDTIERIDQLVSTVEQQAEQIDQLQQNLSDKDEEQILLQQRLDDTELELRTTIESLQEEIRELNETKTSLNER